MRKLLLGLLAVIGLLVFAAPVQAQGGSVSFASSSPSASSVHAAFTVENNRVYTLTMFDSSGAQVCASKIDATTEGLSNGDTFSLVCYANTVAAYSATLTVEHSTRYTPTFTWAT